MTNIFLKSLRKLKDFAYKYYKGFYRFDCNKYPKTFLAHTHKSEKLVKRKDIKEVIYCFWTGDNEMTENRKRCLDEMKEKMGYPVILITKDNLANYILPKYPLHKAYDFLSAVHKSDYLRVYFMHHYGGGYSDVKTPLNQWKNSFNSLNNDDVWVVGCAEPYGLAVAPPKFKVIEEDYKDLKYDLIKYYRYISWAGSFICRPYTNFTYEWLDRLHEILDREYENLKKNPGKIHGWEYPEYPFYGEVGSAGYTAILAQIFHPLCLKYHRHIKFDKNLLLSFKNYR